MYGAKAEKSPQDSTAENRHWSGIYWIIGLVRIRIYT